MTVESEWPRRTRRCSRPAGHNAGARHSVPPAPPAAELRRSARPLAFHSQARNSRAFTGISQAIVAFPSHQPHVGRRFLTPPSTAFCHRGAQSARQQPAMPHAPVATSGRTQLPVRRTAIALHARSTPAEAEHSGQGRWGHGASLRNSGRRSSGGRLLFAPSHIPWLPAPNDPAQRPAHAGGAVVCSKPSVAWPVCCSAWFGPHGAPR